jgi:hypothetical protein
MATSTIEIVAAFRDLASQGVERLGGALQRLTQIGIEPIAKLSPTAGRALQGLITRMGPMGLVAGAAGGAVVAMASALVSLANAAAKADGELYDLSRRTGASVEALSSFRLLAEQSGVALGDVARGFGQMQRAVVAAGHSTGEAQETFRALGVNLAELRRQTPEQQFETLARQIAGIVDPAQRTAAALEVFGKAGAELLPLLADLSDQGLPAVIAKAEELGLVVSGDAARAADEFGDALAELGAATTAVGHGIGRVLLPPLTQLIKDLTAAGTAARQGKTDLAEWFNALAGRGPAAPSGPLSGGGASGGFFGGASGVDPQAVAKEREALAKLEQGAITSILERAAAERQAAGDTVAALQLAAAEKLTILDQETTAALAAVGKTFTTRETQERAWTAIVQQEAEKRKRIIAELEADIRAEREKTQKVTAGLAAAVPPALEAISSGTARIREQILETFGPAGLSEATGQAASSLIRVGESAAEAAPPVRDLASSLATMPEAMFAVVSAGLQLITTLDRATSASQQLAAASAAVSRELTGQSVDADMLAVADAAETMTTRVLSSASAFDALAVSGKQTGAALASVSAAERRVGGGGPTTVGRVGGPAGAGGFGSTLDQLVAGALGLLPQTGFGQLGSPEALASAMSALVTGLRTQARTDRIRQDILEEAERRAGLRPGEARGVVTVDAFAARLAALTGAVEETTQGVTALSDGMARLGMRVREAAAPSGATVGIIASALGDYYRTGGAGS